MHGKHLCNSWKAPNADKPIYSLVNTRYVEQTGHGAEEYFQRRWLSAAGEVGGLKENEIAEAATCLAHRVAIPNGRLTDPIATSAAR
jgi:hypothetical protein